MASSPTQRTLKKLRDDGWHATVVERWNPHAKIRQDLFGFIDVLGLCEDRGLIGIQATSASNKSSRVKKILGTPLAKTWVAAGNQLEVWGWVKRKAPDSNRIKWQPIIEIITTQSFV